LSLPLIVLSLLKVAHFITFAPQDSVHAITVAKKKTKAWELKRTTWGRLLHAHITLAHTTQVLRNMRSSEQSLDSMELSVLEIYQMKACFQIYFLA
jgi:hypothetical protein